MVADLDPLGITTSAPQEIGGTKRRANENVTRKYFNFGKDYNNYHNHFFNFLFDLTPFFFNLLFVETLIYIFWKLMPLIFIRRKSGLKYCTQTHIQIHVQSSPTKWNQLKNSEDKEEKKTVKNSYDFHIFFISFSLYHSFWREALHWNSEIFGEILFINCYHYMNVNISHLFIRLKLNNRYKAY